MMDMRLDGETDPEESRRPPPCHDYSPFGSVNRQRSEAEIDLAIIQVRNVILHHGSDRMLATLRDEWPGLYHAIMRLIQVT
jgi:hypothetical protein